MTLPSTLDVMAEVRGAAAADLSGRVLEKTSGAVEVTDESATAAAAAIARFGEAGAAAGLSRLEMLLVKSAPNGTVAAVRPDAFLLVLVDPSRGTKAVEKALQAWATTAASPSAGPPPVPPTPRPAPPIAALPREPARPPPIPPATPTPVPGVRSAPDAKPPAAAGEPARDDAWASLRRALVRGQLTEAASRQRELRETSPAGNRPGSEPLPPQQRERAIQLLLEGIGGIMAGDGVGGARTLRELADPGQKNLSVRWLALCWSARAAVKSGSAPAARAFIKDALTIARDLDVEARGVSQWIAAEVLAHDSDPTRALAWIHEARSRFERIADRWGIAQTWLTEGRILAQSRREPESVEAAGQARAALPDWDEPVVFLARRAVMRGGLEEAERILEPIRSPAAERVRRLIEAVRQKNVSEADATEFLQVHDAAPSAGAIRTLERIANAWPRFLPAREALAWMLLKLGKYADAGTIFRGLLAEPVAPGDRASVMLGLGCIANARGASEPETSLRAAVTAAAENRVQPGAASAMPRLSTSSLLVRTAQNANGAGAVFSGQLGDFALPDLLEFLRSARRTGVLVCSAANGMGALRFRDGRITGAASQATPRVGQLLLEARKISALALRTVTAAGGDPSDDVVGEKLVREGLAEAAAVQDAFRRQIELTVRELVQWKDGEFAFNRDGEGDAPQTEISVALDPQAVLLALFKEMDERARDSVGSHPQP